VLEAHVGSEAHRRAPPRPSDPGGRWSDAIVRPRGRSAV